ncbi:MAG: Hsp33 family molecular chaperone HslO [Firmicutes bacterium]|nr:Hsp33 family molecular chaperone HslO [Bacillota bacterium]
MTETVAMGRLLRGILGDQEARVLLCDTTAMAQAARGIHGASNVCSAALGRAISAGALLSASAEEAPNSLTMTFKGNGPAGSLVVVSHGRKLKAYIDNPAVTLPLRPDGKLDVGGAVGSNGRLTVVRDLGLKEPYVGQTSLQNGEIAEDVAFYCTVSEQQPTLCGLGVLVSEGGVLSSAGLMVQPLPGCGEKILGSLEARAPVYADLSAHALEMTLEKMFEEFFRGLMPKVLAIEPLAFACDCTRERMERVLLSLGREELTDMMRTQHGAEITCNFCRTKHFFAEDELRALLAQA